MLWNAAYDSILRITLPSSVKVICFADDATVKVFGESIEVVELTAALPIDI